MKTKILEPGNLKRLLPSAKIFITILLLTFFVLLLLFINKKGGDYVSQKNKELLSSSITVSEVGSIDSDKDGVSDWEEKLWGTDPYQKVSNPDGVSDKDYVEKKRQEQENKDLTDLSKKPETTTDKITSQMITTILALSEAGGEIKSEELAKALASSSVAQIQKEIAPRIYTRANFTIVGTSTAEVNLYKRHMSETFSSSNFESLSKSYNTINEALLSNDPEKLLEVSLQAKTIEIILKKLLSAEVPVQYLEKHTIITNSVSVIHKSVVNAPILRADPLKGAALYGNHVNAFIVLIQTLNTFNE